VETVVIKKIRPLERGEIGRAAGVFSELAASREYRMPLPCTHVAIDTRACRACALPKLAAQSHRHEEIKTTAEHRCIIFVNISRV